MTRVPVSYHHLDRFSPLWERKTSCPGQSLSHLRKAQAFHPKQGKRLRLQDKEKKLELKVNFPDQIDEDEKGLERRWGSGSSLFLEFGEGGL